MTGGLCSTRRHAQHTGQVTGWKTLLGGLTAWHLFPATLQVAAQASQQAPTSVLLGAEALWSAHACSTEMSSNQWQLRLQHAYQGVPVARAVSASSITWY